VDASGDIWNRAVSLADTPSFQALAQTVRDWEPSLEVEIPPRDALLYEPDGTLYAVCLREQMTVITGHRERLVRRGDLIVVPQAVAVDARPDVELLAVRYDGPPPDHFRERFSQVWGLEHIAWKPQSRDGRSIVSSLVASDEVRHRLPYSVAEVNTKGGSIETRTGDVLLLIGLDGTPAVAIQSAVSANELELCRGQIVAVSALSTVVFEGNGTVGILGLRTELAHQARRSECLRSGRGISQVYEPPEVIE
jgi:hypothetical protein